MRQTFHIGQDEEITNLVGRLRKAKSRAVVFVVPQGSLVLGSLINLKLLKLEAEELEKEIALVTQDEQGMMLAKKAGIVVEPYAESTHINDHGRPETFTRSSAVQNFIAAPEKRKLIAQRSVDTPVPPVNQNTKSMDFSPLSKKTTTSFAPAKHTSTPENIDTFQRPNPLDQSLVVSPVAKHIEPPSVAVSLERARNHDRSRKNILEVIRQKNATPIASREQVNKTHSFRRWGKVLEVPKSFLSSRLSKPRKHANDQENLDDAVVSEVSSPHIAVSGGIRYVAWGFTFLGVLLFLATSAYIYLPKASVTLYPKIVQNQFDTEYLLTLGSLESGVKSSMGEVIVDKSVQYPTTGKKASTGTKKATGTVTIYNTFGTQPQTLVATTRLLSSEGKLFRLTKTVTVPGMQGENPGILEVAVEADQGGESFNIPPTKFTIPGFSGTPKESAFYAKSEIAFSDGASGDSNDVSVISQQDIEKARQEILKAVIGEAQSQVEQDTLVGLKVLPDLAVVDVLESKASPAVLSVASEFTYRVKARVRLVAFDEQSLKKDIEQKMRDHVREQSAHEVDIKEVQVTYGNIIADFDKKTIHIPVQAQSTAQASLDIAQVKKDIVGMKKEAMQSFLDTHQGIEKMDIELFPAGLSNNIPRFENRVEVKLAQ